MCAADAAIWAEQQFVAIPGWLREDQNARLHQEEHFARRMRQKEEFLAAGEGVQDGDPSHSPPPPIPVATFGPEPVSFQESWQVFKAIPPPPPPQWRLLVQSL